MARYIFKTTTTMKEYNNEKWWIDSNFVRDKSIVAEDLKEAMDRYRKLVEKNDYVTISDNAMKNKNPMYIDTEDGIKQIGYVITGKTDFQDDFGRWTEQYIDLWVSIITVVDTEF